MSSPNQSEILRLAFARLDTFPALVSKIGAGRVHNHLPQECDLPRVRVRWQDCTEWDTKDSDGWEGDIVVDVWTAERGDKLGLEISDIIDDALHEYQIPSVSGQSITSRHTTFSAFTEPDGITHHTTARFHVIVST
jgi:hypothetical protein